MYYTGNGVSATVHSTSGSGASEDPMCDCSATGYFAEWQMIH